MCINVRLGPGYARSFACFEAWKRSRRFKSLKWSVRAQSLLCRTATCIRTHLKTITRSINFLTASFFSITSWFGESSAHSDCPNTHAQIYTKLHTMEESHFERLPDETILHIVKNIARDVTTFLSNTGRIVVDDDIQTATDLRALSLVSRRLRPIAQEVLFSAPLLCDPDRRTIYYECSAIVRFIRTLMQQPHLREHVKHLRITLNEANIANNGDATAAREGEIWAFLTHMPLAPALRNAIRPGAITRNRWTQIGVLMTLTTRLQYLTIMPKHNSARYEGHGDSDLLGGMLKDGSCLRDVAVRLPFRQLPGFVNLKGFQFRMDSFKRIKNLHLLPQLTTLDITPVYDTGEALKQDLREFEKLQALLPVDLRADFGHISHLRLNYLIGFRGKYVYLREEDLLPPCLAMLKHFPNLRILDIYGHSSQENLKSKSRDNKYLPIVQEIEKHLADVLEVLRLPSIYIHSDIHYPDELPFPDLSRFKTLRRLLVPHEVLAVQTATYREGRLAGIIDWVDTAPLKYLPPNLECLEVFDADQSMFDWVDNIIASEEQFLALKKVTILFGQEPKYSDQSYDDFMRRGIRKSFWRAIEKSRIEWTVGRDETNHATDLLE